MIKITQIKNLLNFLDTYKSKKEIRDSKIIPKSMVQTVISNLFYSGLINRKKSKYIANKYDVKNVLGEINGNRSYPKRIRNV